MDYVAQMKAELGGREPVEVFARTPGILREMIEGVGDEVLRRRPYADAWTWTVLEVVGHLVDVEWTLGWRLRTILCDDGPVIAAMDQEKWVVRQKHNEGDPRKLLDEFEVLRGFNLRLWRTLSGEQLRERYGIHAERGRETLEQLMLVYAGHDLRHLEQVRRYLGAMGGGDRGQGTGRT